MHNRNHRAALALWAGVFWIPVSLATAQPAVDGDLRAGLVALGNNDLVQACELLERAVKRNPENAVGWAALAQAQLRSGQRDRAMEAGGKAGQFGKGTPAVEHALAMLYAEMGDPAAAADWELRFVRSPGAGGGAAQEAFVSELGQALLERLDFERAVALLTEGRRLFPQSARIAVAYGVACYGRRRFEDAVTAFLDAIDLDSSMEQPYTFLGRMLDHAGERLPRIIRAYAEWEKKAPDSWLPLFLHAKALAAAPGPPAAGIEAELRRSIALNGSFWESHLELGAFLAGRADWDAAGRELIRAIELNPRSARAHYQLARVYQHEGKAELALRERAEYERLNEAANGGEYGVR